MDLRTGCAFWVLNNGLLATDPSLAHDESADVAVLGAGITGAATAYHLTQIDAWRNAGMPLAKSESRS